MCVACVFFGFAAAWQAPGWHQHFFHLCRCGRELIAYPHMMSGLPQSLETRNQLRIELSDYLLARMGEQWMLDLLVAPRELDGEDFELYCSYGSRPAARPTTLAPAVADPPAYAPDTAAPGAEHEPEAVAEESMDAMRWASRLVQDASVLALLRSLPSRHVAEHIALYRKRDKPAVADVLERELELGKIRTHQQRMYVALRFHTYCKSPGTHADRRTPYGGR